MGDPAHAGAAAGMLAPAARLRIVLSRRGASGAGVGGLLGVPLMCSACSAPVSLGFRRSGASVETSLGLIVGSALFLHPDPLHPGRRQLTAGAVFLVLMGGSAAYSANVADLRDRFAPPSTRLAGPLPAGSTAVGAAGGPAVPDAPGAAAATLRSRSQPWWQPVTTLTGDGARSTHPVTIDDRALQWRVTWQCTGGSFAITPIDRGGTALRPLAQAGACPANGVGYSVQTGRFTLDVTAGGSWKAVVEQQVDVPLVEPPLPATTQPGARVLASGAMYDIDRVGTGTARIHQLPDGSSVLRLEDFFVSINSDLEIWLSEAAHPTSTEQAAQAPHHGLGLLKATTGSMNYRLPADLELSRYRSIVIWCELTRNAYAAATLTR